MESVEKIRHCAFCLKLIKDQTIKLCGKCRKRAYCSRECQIADWTSDGNGQGHKNWCVLQCGEEDIDWYVSEITGKGLGLVAKRFLPAKYRIIVDCCRTKNDHQAIKDLMPINGTFKQKFDLNSLGRDDGSAALCLRISRANHDCKANADHWYDETFKVVILYAQRDIAEGEEICINYQLYNDISKEVTAQQARFVLQNKWGITCPMNCFCYDKEMEKIITRSRKLDQKIIGLASQGNVSQALDNVTELLNNHDIVGSSLLNKARTLYDGFQIVIMKKTTFKTAETLVKQLYEIQSSILSPESSAVKETERKMNDFSSHHNYLRLG